MLIFEKEGDVCNQKRNVVIAHCISVDCAMGAGVVIPIKKKFPGLKPACQEYVANSKDALGSTFRYETDAGVCYNMFTKRHVRDNFKTLGDAYLTSLHFCLIDLRESMIANNEEFLAIPKIGSGLDCCSWATVKSIIEEVFSATDIKIKVCLW